MAFTPDSLMTANMLFQSSPDRLVLMVTHAQFFRLSLAESFARMESAVAPDAAMAGRPTLMVFRKVRLFIISFPFLNNLSRGKTSMPQKPQAHENQDALS